MISGHVPAWKRVGLTLKYQPLVVNPVPVDTIVPITSQKRLWKIEHDKAPETKRSRQNPTHSHIAEASSASTPLLGPEKSYHASPPSPSTGDNIEKSAFEKVGTAAHETPSTGETTLFFGTFPTNIVQHYLHSSDISTTMWMIAYTGSSIKLIRLIC